VLAHLAGESVASGRGPVWFNVDDEIDWQMVVLDVKHAEINFVRGGYCYFIDAFDYRVDVVFLRGSGSGTTTSRASTRRSSSTSTPRRDSSPARSTSSTRTRS